MKNTRKDDEDFEEELTEEDRERIRRMMNYEHLNTVPELEKELRKVEKLRRKINFEKRFKRIKKDFEKTEAILKQKGWTEKDLVRDMYNAVELNALFNDKSPHTALGVAMREHRALTRYIIVLQETIKQFSNEIKEKFGIREDEKTEE